MTLLLEERRALMSARELYVFYTPSDEESDWAGRATDSDGSLLGMVLALKCFQRMGRFPKQDEVPERQVVASHEDAERRRSVRRDRGPRKSQGIRPAPTRPPPQAPGPDATIRYSTIPGSTRYLGTSLTTDWDPDEVDLAGVGVTSRGASSWRGTAPDRADLGRR